MVQDGVVLNASLGFVNANSNSLEKWNGISLARSEDNDLATLPKPLKNLFKRNQIV